jgi:hypothetical protein
MSLPQMQVGVSVEFGSKTRSIMDIGAPDAWPLLDKSRMSVWFPELVKARGN